MNKFIELRRIKKELAEIKQEYSLIFEGLTSIKLVSILEDLTEVVLTIAD